MVSRQMSHEIKIAAESEAFTPLTSVVSPGVNRYPYCLTWSPLPMISWFLPFVGHTGIADSHGVIYDFAGPYTIGKEHMAFGEPTRYIQMDPRKCTEMDWDAGIQAGCTTYSRRMHNIFCDNCHNHVATCLNYMGYSGLRSRGMVRIAVVFFFQGKFTSAGAFIRTYLPFTVIVAIILLAKLL